MSDRPQNKHLKPFQPGQSGNPLGGKKHDPHLKALKKVLQTEVIDMVGLLLNGDMETLKDLAFSKDTSVLKVWISCSILHGIERGDIGPLEVLLTRVLGKPKMCVEVSQSADDDLAVRVQRMNAELLMLKSEPKP